MKELTFRFQNPKDKTPPHGMLRMVGGQREEQSPGHRNGATLTSCPKSHGKELSLSD
jgi:hypothetical protein